jgi:hypothetical protein
MSNIHSLEIDIADVKAVARGELQTIRTQLQAIGSACSDPQLLQLVTTAQRQVAEADDLIAGQIAFLAEDLELFTSSAQSKSMIHTIQPTTLDKVKIKSRDDLSFTKRDAGGLMINWPRKNPGVATDWKKGIGFFDGDITALAGVNETEAYDAITYALLGMGGHYTNLEFGFIQTVARAAVLGLRATRGGAAQFEPIDEDEPDEEVA